MMSIRIALILAAIAVGHNQGSGTKATGRLELIVSLPKREFRIGEAIPLITEFRNRSPLPVTIWFTHFPLNHQIIVTDEKGVEPPLTETGIKFRKLFSPGGARDGNRRMVLAPGRSLRVAGEDGLIPRGVDLAELYKLGPGRYRVRVTYHEIDRFHNDKEVKVSSEAFPFEVR